MQNSLLIVFSRLPVLGKVKKRLAKKLGDAKALEIHKKLLDYTLKISLESGIPYKIYLSEQANTKQIFDYEVQIGSNLGDRMNNAMISELLPNDSVCVIGSDCLALTSKDLSNAFKQLAIADVVIGPAVDGGYYLIGTKKPYPQLFKNVSWGSSTVLEETLKICQDSELSVKLLEPLKDIDHSEDLPASWL